MAVAPISSPRGGALRRPPAMETCAPRSTGTLSLPSGCCHWLRRAKLEDGMRRCQREGWRFTLLSPGAKIASHCSGAGMQTNRPPSISIEAIFMMIHPWHDLEPGTNVPDEMSVVVEIPRGSRNKYELDK